MKSLTSSVFVLFVTITAAAAGARDDALNLYEAIKTSEVLAAEIVKKKIEIEAGRKKGDIDLLRMDMMLDVIVPVMRAEREYWRGEAWQRYDCKTASFNFQAMAKELVKWYPEKDKLDTLVEHFHLAKATCKASLGLPKN